MSDKIDYIQGLCRFQNTKVDDKINGYGKGGKQKRKIKRSVLVLFFIEKKGKRSCLTYRYAYHSEKLFGKEKG